MSVPSVCTRPNNMFPLPPLSPGSRTKPVITSPNGRGTHARPLGPVTEDFEDDDDRGWLLIMQ